MEADNYQGKKFAPVGVCIYCGSDGKAGGLGTEHIVPYSLGGTAELPEASCRDCERVTSYLDGYLARSIYYHLRVHTDTQSRRGYPELLPVTVETKEGERKLFLPAKDQPFFTNMPVWNTPGIIRGAQPSDDFGDARAHVYWSVPETFRTAIGMKDGEPAIIKDTSKPIHLPTFARAIAKIGYCHAVVRYGVNGFRRLVLPDLILGKYPCIPYFVGGDPTDPPAPAPRGRMHTFQIDDLTFQRLKLIMVSFRIFAHSGTHDRGMPVYRVVVGAPRLA